MVDRAADTIVPGDNRSNDLAVLVRNPEETGLHRLLAPNESDWLIPWRVMRENSRPKLYDALIISISVDPNEHLPCSHIGGILPECEAATQGKCAALFPRPEDRERLRQPGHGISAEFVRRSAAPDAGEPIVLPNCGESPDSGVLRGVPDLANPGSEVETQVRRGQKACVTTL
jgi:hypothetical protein